MHLPTRCPPSPTALLVVATCRTCRTYRICRTAAWLAALAALAGCSVFDRAVPGAAGGQPTPVLRLEVLAPRPLDTLLATQLDLGRVNRLAAGEPLQEGELERLMAGAPQQARELLDTEGYFNARISVQRVDGGGAAGAAALAAAASAPASPEDTARAIGAVPAASAVAAGAASSAASAPLAGGLPVVRVLVEPGPRTVVRRVDLAVQGPLAEARSTDAHARQAEQALRRDWPLQPGEPFRDAEWSRAKTASIAGLRAQGYVQADWARTQATVDAATQQADLEGSLASGPLFRIGPLQVRGLKVQDARTVANIANLTPGAPATEATLLDIQERLQKSDLFSSATVALDTTPPQPDATPVVVRLGERQLQQATFGVGVGANVGPRATVNHVHRRPFGQPWVARNALELSRVQQRWAGELSTQTLPGLYRNLVGGGFSRETSSTDVVRSTSVRVGRAQETRRISRLLFADWNRSTTTSALGRSESDALALQYHGVWRLLDDYVLPTNGRAWSGQFGVGQARSSPGGQGPFGRVYGRLDLFRPLGRGWFGQGRVELGQVISRSGVQVPEALRFRAGGDESVRGYAYRSLTRQVNGVDVGSEVLFTASLEAARPLLESFPQLWGAVFIDVGRAAERWNDLKPAVGVGAGLRYRSPVGPVKLDLAWGEEVRKLRLHLSVGLAF